MVGALVVVTFVVASTNYCRGLPRNRAFSVLAKLWLSADGFDILVHHAFLHTAPAELQNLEVQVRTVAKHGEFVVKAVKSQPSQSSACTVKPSFA